MRNRFDEQLEQLNNHLLEMGALIERSIENATQALIKQDVEAANAAIAADQEVDHKEREIESLCLKLLLQQQPVAKDLRLISAALKMITDMERIGDQAADISGLVIYIANEPYFKDLVHLPQMGEKAIRMVRGSLDAYVSKDLELARDVMNMDDEIDDLFDIVKNELIDHIRSAAASGSQAVDLLMIAKYYERIGDHAQNIAEWVEYALTGMEDPPGIFKCALRCKTVTVQWLHDPMEIPKEKSESRKEHSVTSYPYPFFLAMLEAAILLWYNEAVQHLNMGGWYMAANYSFRAYIKNNYFDRVYAAATRFIETEYARIYTSINRLPEPANISLQDVAIKSIRIGNQNDLNIAFDMLVAASLSIRESIAKAPISQAICLNICCQADLATDLLDLKVTEVRLSEGHVIFYDTLLSDTLVPIIRKADLERVANKLLKKYYPDALTRPMAIDPYAFADKMGLIVVKRHLSTDYSIFGRIFFCDADDGIKAGTICVDPDANYAYRGGNVGTSIIHECVHWALHRKALAFRRLHDAGLTDLSCATDNKHTEEILKDVSLLEWQANALAARIQMPLVMFRKQAKDTLAKLHRDTGKTDTLDVIEDVIEELARFYGVSRLATKIRMIDAGFSEAAGAYNYIDGHYAAPHRLERNLAEANVVFTIDTSDAAGLFFENEAFRNLIESKGYLYVDGHFVLNDDAYIARTDSGTLSLTPYALRHMEECCIPFKVCSKEHGEISLCDITTLFSKSRKSKRTYYRFIPKRYIPGDLNSSDQIIDLKEDEEDQVIDQMLTADAELCQKLPRDFREALNDLIHKSKKTYTKLSDETGINKQTIGRLTNPKSTTVRKFPNLETLVLLLFALHTGPLTSEEIIRMSSFNLNPIANEKHRWIKFALHCKYAEPLSEILAFLEKHGVNLKHEK